VATGWLGEARRFQAFIQVASDHEEGESDNRASADEVTSPPPVASASAVLFDRLSH
jgi:hypothetical protein